MIKIEKVEVLGWEQAIRGMRNPKNSGDKSDSIFSLVGNPKKERFEVTCEVGENDLSLMKRLVKAGTDHRKFMRMIVVYADITAPLYWWKEFDTYKVGTVANSCSTMHKIQEKEFTLEDFSCEHLLNNQYEKALSVLENVIECLNYNREQFLKTGDKLSWWQMIQLLPSSYNQKRTVMLNYEVLANIYKKTSRRHHKLDEWNVDCEGSFCSWINSLPYSELITGEDDV